MQLSTRKRCCRMMSMKSKKTVYILKASLYLAKQGSNRVVNFFYISNSVNFMLSYNNSIWYNYRQVEKGLLKGR